MNTISINTRVFVAPRPIDFRKRLDGTAAECRKMLGKNPLEGGLFLFINKKRTRLRGYLCDGHGEWLIEKRVLCGKFSWWAEQFVPQTLEPTLLNLLFRGGNPAATPLPSPWKIIT